MPNDVIDLESALIKIASLAAAAMMLDGPGEEILRNDIINLIQTTAEGATSSKKGDNHA
ncbi:MULTISPECIES: hypothetical protein [Klebsiella pneumoniae complex]|uniref:hypothetical protein n=1 Tax=Klebsiella pneumoniae complex TaxID=3390273 RepID=UPI0015E84CEB|nr:MULTISPECIES: hypothetical protein [Klebsiella]MDW7253964.1 hypothetical protein [Klebsiella pneumoniae]HBR1654949.1 hypothetical protein [Klebsiella pneumoniae]HCM5869907.1 hypothetical protein [Klebsiella pneumoniae]